MIETIVAGAFSVIMLMWNIYLMRQNSILVNKLMSRSYADYVGASTYASKGPSLEPENSESQEVADPFDEQRARDLNAMMGMG